MTHELTDIITHVEHNTPKDGDGCLAVAFTSRAICPLLSRCIRLLRVPLTCTAFCEAFVLYRCNKPHLTFAQRRRELYNRQIAVMKGRRG